MLATQINDTFKQPGAETRVLVQPLREGFRTRWQFHVRTAEQKDFDAGADRLQGAALDLDYFDFTGDDAGGMSGVGWKLVQGELVVDARPIIFYNHRQGETFMHRKNKTAAPMGRPPKKPRGKFRQALFDHIRKMGVTREEFARRARLKERTVYAYLAGERRPSRLALLALKKVGFEWL
jgi:hypothetical protein